MKRIISILFVAVAIQLSTFAQSQTQLKWQLGSHKTATEQPAKWIASTVPGAIQLDVMVAEKYKQPYWYANNFEQFMWMESQFFTYKTTFSKPALKEDQRVYFHSKGIDYSFIIYLNGEKLLEQEGMFTYVDIDLTDKLKNNNELKITLLPVPMVPGSRTTQSHFRDNARKSVKPAVSYGWDWHPRLITRGIWDETYLDLRNENHLKSVWVRYELDDKLENASLQTIVEGNLLKGLNYNWTLTAPDGKIVLQKNGVFETVEPTIAADLKNIKLWWPNGYGKAELYTSKLEISKNNIVLDTKTNKVGFKTVKLVVGEGGWNEQILFPKGRAVAPATFEVNGKVIFAKGSNWVHPEIFMGLATRETYERHIKLAKEANMNIFRVWGGGVTNKESFFDLCDEYGIMVWQEFPLACNQYPDEKPYIAVLKQEATSIIKRVRTHASLALWCGGNELFNDWSMMTEQSIAMRLLNKLCFDLNPEIPFNYTSPVNGMAHGHYVFWDPANGGEVFQWLPKAHYTAYTEFGVPGTANLEVLKTMMPANELFPPKLGTSWESHHAFGVWGKDRWLELPFLTEYFGEITNLEELVKYSQLTQCEGYKCIFEEARRQKPYCGMAVNWDFQEPWPCAANNSLINYPSSPKPSLYAVGKSLRPVLASARIPKFRWDDGELFSCELFLLNDTYDQIPTGKMTAKLVFDDGKEIPFLTWEYPATSESKNIVGPTARVKLPKIKSNLFKLVLEVEGKPEYKSEYTFVYRSYEVLNAKPKVTYLNGVTD